MHSNTYPADTILSKYGLLGNHLSGKVIWRPKRFAKHKGVVLGVDATGTTWVVHNHPRTNIALVTMAEFCRGNAWFVDEADANMDQDTVISNAVYFLEKGLPYSVLRMNCQHTSSMIAQGKKYSEDLRKFTRALVVATPPLFWLARTFLRLVR